MIKMKHFGRGISVLASLMLLMSAFMKLRGHPDVAKGMVHLGLPDSMVLPLGIVELVSVVLYLIPQTSVLGAILCTGYMGGAILAHLRIGEPIWIQILLGVAFWGGLYLRDLRIRTLLPIRQK